MKWKASSLNSIYYYRMLFALGYSLMFYNAIIIAL